jgi:hypothetical protein
MKIRSMIVAAGLATAILVGFAGLAGASGIRAVPSTVPAPVGVTYSMFGNNTESDCTVAAAGAMVEVWQAKSGVTSTAVVGDVQHVWKALGAPNAGLDPTTVLSYWTNHAIDGYKVRYTNQGDAGRLMIEQDVTQNGGAYVQVRFSAGFMNYIDTNAQGVWSHQDGNGANVDYHQIDVIGYTNTTVTIATWGETYTATWQWFAAHEVQTFEVVPVR